MSVVLKLGAPNQCAVVPSRRGYTDTQYAQISALFSVIPRPRFPPRPPGEETPCSPTNTQDAQISALFCVIPRLSFPTPPSRVRNPVFATNQMHADYRFMRRPKQF